MTVFALDPLDLAALLCSRVCHDVIGPVGAIINGLEMLDENQDAEMRGFALDLIKTSAEKTSARLQFCRLAFGAAGSVRASIDTHDAATVARGGHCAGLADLPAGACTARAIQQAGGEVFRAPGRGPRGLDLDTMASSWYAPTLIWRRRVAQW